MIPSAGSMFSPGGDIRLVPQLHIDMFFDRDAVTNALTRGEKRAFSRASLYVRRQAQRSIRKMGLAKPKLRIMSQFPGMSLQTIANLPGMPKATGQAMRDSRGRLLPGSNKRTVRTGITDRERDAVLQRIKEIKTRPQSQPGTPPHTHVPFGMMLGFRRNLYNAYDAATHSAVVGPTKKGPHWKMPMLHEFGGTKEMAAYVWKPKWQPYKNPIMKWVSSLDEEDRANANWIPTGIVRRWNYPARPFMRPALERSRGRIAEEFRNILGG